MARETKKAVPGLRKALQRLALAVCGVALSAAIACYLVERYLVSSPSFALARGRRDALSIEGLRYTSRARVQRIFAEDLDRSIFAAPLDERRRRLMALDWVEDAAVSRIWPDRLAVRIVERRPVAFVHVQSMVMLIDEQGMLLDPPPRAEFAFPVLSGIRPEDSPARRLEAVRALLDLEDALGPQMKDISEVDAADPGNLRIVAQVDGRVVELILGEDNLGPRYRNFRNHFAEIRKGSPEAKVFDLRLDDRITAKE